MNGKLKVQKTAQFSSIGINHATKVVWIALHGYGMLAKYFIRKFNVLGPEHAVFCPEGLNRFYHAGYNGKVGASWMTKEEREDDIADNQFYLDEFWNEIIQPQLHKGIEKVIVLGFSQGSATAARWVNHHSKPITDLILWAGAFPPDIQIEDFGHFDHIKLWEVYGSPEKDKFINGEEMTKQVLWLKELGMNIEKRVFDMGHDIEAEPLMAIASELLPY